MGYGVFTAVGTVAQVSDKQTQRGSAGKVVLLKLDTREYNGAANDVMLEVSAWGKVAEQAASLAPGMQVSVSGQLESQLSQSGYWNVRPRVQAIVPLQQQGYAQPQQSYAQQPYQPQAYAQQGYAQPQQPALYDKDIPF